MFCWNEDLHILGFSSARDSEEKLVILSAYCIDILYVILIHYWLQIVDKFFFQECMFQKRSGHARG